MNRNKLITDNIPSTLQKSPEARLEKLQNDLSGIYNRIITQKKTKKSKEILVVDESETIQENVKFFLKIHGFKVTTTENGLKALNHFHNSSFDLILTAVCVPGLNGNLIARYVKNHMPELPIIGMSQSAWMAEDYFDIVVQKPLDFAALLQEVNFQISKSAGFMKTV